MSRGYVWNLAEKNNKSKLRRKIAFSTEFQTELFHPYMVLDIMDGQNFKQSKDYKFWRNFINFWCGFNKTSFVWIFYWILHLDNRNKSKENCLFEWLYEFENSLCKSWCQSIQKCWFDDFIWFESVWHVQSG